MDFDLRTPDSAYAFVQNILGITGEQFIDEYVIECDRDYERLWKKYYSHLKYVDASRIRIWAFHVTGSLDHCQCICTYKLQKPPISVTAEMSGFVLVGRFPNPSRTQKNLRLRDSTNRWKSR